MAKMNADPVRGLGTNTKMALKIYFCDGCNESIPLKDINDNRITIDAGKIFCSKCAPKKPTRESTRSSPAVVGALVLLIGLGFGLIAYITAQQMHELQADLRTANGDVGALKESLAAFRHSAMPREEAERLRTQVLDDLMIAKRELAGQSDRIKIIEALVHTEVQKLEKSLSDSTRNELTALARQFEKLGEDFRAQAASYDALRGSLGSIESAIAQLRTDVETVKKERPAAGSGPDSGPSEPLLRDDSARDLLSLLKDSDPGRRFQAVMELSRFRSPGVVEALAGMLQDPETYVRDGSVRALRKINLPAAIPSIIKALRDEDYFVRSSAREALRSMTAAEVSFDPGADATERERAVREWENWWQMNSERLLKK
jgi:hypothetical protein